MVATDSYRLAVKRTELEAELGGELEANIPARALRELGRILSSEGAGETSISLLANQAVFVAGSILLSTRLIDGQFPNFRQLLPESYEHDVRLPRSDFLDVTRRVSQLAQRNAPLRLSFESGELTVAAETPDVGDARETMPAAFEGEALEIGFNPEFLREGIESVAGRRGAAAADLAAAAGAAGAGRGRRLPLPGDADPPQRLSVATRRAERRVLVTAIEAKPLRSLERVRVELAPGIVSVIGPNGTGKTNLVEALYFALTGRSFRTSDRRDLIPFGGTPGPGRGDDPRRGRDRAHAARLGQPQRRPAPPARRQPRGPGDAGAQPAAGGGLRPRPADPGEGAAGRAPRPPRRLHRRPLAGAGGAAQALRAGGRAAQRAALAARRRLRLAGGPADLGRGAGRRRRAADRGAGGGGRRARRSLRRPRRPSSGWRRPTLEYAPRAEGSAEEIRAGLRGAPRRRTSASAAAPGAPTSTS